MCTGCRGSQAGPQPWLLMQRPCGPCAGGGCAKLCCCASQLAAAGGMIWCLGSMCIACLLLAEKGGSSGLFWQPCMLSSFASASCVTSVQAFHYTPLHACRCLEYQHDVCHWLSSSVFPWLSLCFGAISVLPAMIRAISEELAYVMETSSVTSSQHCQGSAVWLRAGGPALRHRVTAPTQQLAATSSARTL